jgi:hypothetical protein
MYYVTRKDHGIINYHARYESQKQAREYAESLKATYGHEYDVIKVETVWTTQTLAQALTK